MAKAREIYNPTWNRWTNSIKVSRTFLQGLLLRRFESRQTYRPSITEATKAPGQQKKKNSKRWVSCKNIPFQQESFIGTSSMDSCGVFNRSRCCRKCFVIETPVPETLDLEKNNKRAMKNSSKWPKTGNCHGGSMFTLLWYAAYQQDISFFKSKFLN